jgi:hypothetical protein
MLHSPGGSIRRADFLRADNDPLAGVFLRIENEEIKTMFIDRPEFVTVYTQLVNRGPEVVQVFLSRIAENADLPEGSFWCDTDSLTKVPGIILHQIKAINLAEKKFISQTSEGNSSSKKPV